MGKSEYLDGVLADTASLQLQLAGPHLVLVAYALYGIGSETRVKGMIFMHHDHTRPRVVYVLVIHLWSHGRSGQTLLLPCALAVRCCLQQPENLYYGLRQPTTERGSEECFGQRLQHLQGHV